MVEGIKDLEFQNECVDFLIQKTAADDSKQVITDPFRSIFYIFCRFRTDTDHSDKSLPLS